MNFIEYLYKRLDDVNKARAVHSTNNARLVWLNGQREILLEIIKDLENDNSSSKANSNN
jgi:hypothetical protein